MTTVQEVVAPALGNVLRIYRERRGLTQERLGLNAELGIGTVHQIEMGRRAPRYDTIKRLLIELGVDWVTFGLDMQAAEPLPYVVMPVQHEPGEPDRRGYPQRGAGMGPRGFPS